MNKILGIDIGGTKTALVAATSDGRIQQRRVFPTRPDRSLDQFLDDVSRVAEELGVRALDCASIAVGGPMDEATRMLINPPHLPAWRNVRLADLLAEKLGVPTYMMHDAKAGAYAEWRFGCGEANPSRRLCFITFATGFGSAFVINGRVLDIPGEIGHWRVAEDGPELFGKRGSLEGLASGAGIAMQATAAGFERGANAERIAELARQGDERARQIMHNVATQVGRQCARLIDLFALDVIALGTIAIKSADVLLDPIRSVAGEEALAHLADRCEIMPAKLGEQIGDYASLSAALVHGGFDRSSGAGAQLSSLAALIEKVNGSPGIVSAVDKAAQTIVQALGRGKKVLTCGNGGSATDAAHLAEELIGRYRNNRPALPAINLAADGSVLTCIANDFGFAEIFSRQVEGLAQEGDVLVAFTTSGKSENINRALNAARQRKVTTVVLTGKGGGEAKSLGDIVIDIPHNASERIQELHTFVLHVICEAVEERNS